MAGSRLEKVGTIFSRLTGLLRSNAMKEEDIPIWYAVYKAFPPLCEPKFHRSVIEKEIPSIFYSEDKYRAKFYKKYGSLGVIDMLNPTSEQLSEKYVKKCQELKTDSNESNLDQIVEEALLADGVTLYRTKSVIKDTKAVVNPDAVLKYLKSEDSNESKISEDDQTKQ